MLATTALLRTPSPLLVPGKGGEGLIPRAAAGQEHGHVPWVQEEPAARCAHGNPLKEHSISLLDTSQDTDSNGLKGSQ